MKPPSRLLGSAPVATLVIRLSGVPAPWIPFSQRRIVRRGLISGTGTKPKGQTGSPALCLQWPSQTPTRLTREMPRSGIKVGEIVKAGHTRLAPVELAVRLRVVAPVPDYRRAAAPGAMHAVWPAASAYEGEALGVVYQAGEVDQIRCSHECLSPSEQKSRSIIPCLSGCYPHPLNVGCAHSPE